MMDKTIGQRKLYAKPRNPVGATAVCIDARSARSNPIIRQAPSDQHQLYSFTQPKRAVHVPVYTRKQPKFSGHISAIGALTKDTLPFPSHFTPWPPQFSSSYPFPPQLALHVSRQLNSLTAYESTCKHVCMMFPFA